MLVWSIGNLQALDRTKTTGKHVQMLGVVQEGNKKNSVGSLLEGCLVQDCNGVSTLTCTMVKVSNNFN